jgi:hypothetical protein
MFIAVDVGAYGRNSGGGIFANSNVGKASEKNLLHLPHDKQLPGSQEKMPHVITGDGAFQLSRHLMKPYFADQISDDEEKKIFNYRLSR